MNELEKNIFKTIAWFDIFDYPLTAWEVFRFQISRPKSGFRQKSEQDLRFKTQGISFEFEKIQRTLKEGEALKKIVGYKQGFYFLKLRDELVKTRKERYIIAEKKYKKLLKISKILAVIPFIRAIAVATGLSYSNSKEEDDIDLFIITAKNRIWLVRFFSILVLKLFKARPTLANKKDKICLNFFISEDNLNLEKIMLPEKNGLADTYFIYWLAWLAPIYNDNIWQKFIEANSWIKKHLPQSFPQEPILKRKIILSYRNLNKSNSDSPQSSIEGLDQIGEQKQIRPSLDNHRGCPKGDSARAKRVPIWNQTCRFFKKFCEKIHGGSFNGLSEKFYRWLQIKVMPKHLKELANQSTSVIINNEMLKFHDQDKREIYRQKFYEKIRQIN